MYKAPNEISSLEIEKLPIEPPYEMEDYAEIIESCGVGYIHVFYHLQVRNIIKTQGWILHLSVVLSQAEDLLKDVIPLLVAERVPFKIPANKETINNLLEGHLGLTQIGKIVTIYPDNDAEGLDMARRLLALTASYRGPSVPTDLCLGNIVYTRYGGFNPVLLPGRTGKMEKFIYDSTGQLVQDRYSIPFEVPDNVSWPFGAIRSPILTKPKRLLNGTYKPQSILKLDPRGNVFKGIFLKNPLKVKKCVIKQGRQYMSSDNSGRSIHDRLAWQQQLYRELKDGIPLPEIYDLFSEDGDSYLVMEYIDGLSLYDRNKEINPRSNSWDQLPLQSKMLVLDYLIGIISITERLHQKGYVHRDIMPSNFLIDKQGEIFLIDMELAYSLRTGRPNPPFQLGTAGFMSPEQRATLTPTEKEDIYGFGATLLEALTGLTPVRFNPKDPAKLFDQIQFFVGSRDISAIITRCLSDDPFVRPDAGVIRDALIYYKQQINGSPGINGMASENEGLNKVSLKRVVEMALAGIIKPPVKVLNDMWYSKAKNPENAGAVVHKEYSRYAGLYDGIAGVLYTLGKVGKTDIDITSCKYAYKKNLDYITENYFNKVNSLSAGLYEGFAGVAVALAKGVEAGLEVFNDDIASRLRICLDTENPKLDVAAGISGQGIGILRCSRYLEKTFVDKKLHQISETLIKLQEGRGSWLLQSDERGDNESRSVSFGYGIPGIIWFLLDYYAIYPRENVRTALTTSLRWLLKRTDHLRNLLSQGKFEKKVLKKEQEKGDERKGIILTFIKAYEVLGTEYYKQIAESALSQYASCMISTNLIQSNGLSGLGELYLEAWRVFKTEEWLRRAHWIANVFLHVYAYNSEHSVYWVLEENNDPTADLMVGISGIIHFLARCFDPDKLGYRMLQ